MNRTEYMKAVYATDLDPVSKAILVYLGFCKNWKEGTMAFPSAAKVSSDTGYGIATVKRKMPELREKGYLSDTGQRRGRGVIVYDLVDPTGITVMPQEYQSDTAQYQSDTAEVSERYTEQVREQVQEPERELVQEATVPDGPVPHEDSQIREESPSFNLENADDGETYLESLLTRNNITGKMRSLARQRYWDEEYEPRLTNGVKRAGWVVLQLTKKECEAS